METVAGTVAGTVAKTTRINTTVMILLSITAILLVSLLVVYLYETIDATDYYKQHEERLHKPIDIHFNMENRLKTTVVANDVVTSPIVVDSNDTESSSQKLQSSIPSSTESITKNTSNVSNNSIG